MKIARRWFYRKRPPRGIVDGSYSDDLLDRRRSPPRDAISTSTQSPRDCSRSSSCTDTPDLASVDRRQSTSIDTDWPNDHSLAAATSVAMTAYSKATSSLSRDVQHTDTNWSVLKPTLPVRFEPESIVDTHTRASPASRRNSSPGVRFGAAFQYAHEDAAASGIPCCPQTDKCNICSQIRNGYTCLTNVMLFRRASDSSLASSLSASIGADNIGLVTRTSRGRDLSFGSCARQAMIRDSRAGSEKSLSANNTLVGDNDTIGNCSNSSTSSCSLTVLSISGAVWEDLENI